MSIVRLELGVGNKKRIKDSIGVDIVKTRSVDVIFDLNYSTLPFKDNCVDEVYCFHVLEHLDDLINIMNEIHRICKNGARVVIEGPHFSCNMAFADPTHRRGFSIFTFDYFALNPSINVVSHYTNKKFKIIKKKLKFGGLPPFRTIKNIFFNKFQNFYERTLTFIFPCVSVEYVLEVVK